MHQLTALFLYAFLVDGLLSVIDLAIRHNLPGSTPNTLAITASIAVLLLGMFLFVAMMFTPRLSKRLLMPPILFLGFCVIWGVIFGTREQLPFSIAQSLLALGLIIGYRNPSGGGLQNFTHTRPFFTLRHFLVTAPLNLATGIVILGLLTLGVAQQLRCKLEESLGSYLTIQPDGISLDERIFSQGDKEIRLVSMIHVAKSGFYDEITKTLPAGANAVVLLEGISDQKRRLEEKLDYSRFADWLGIASQKESSFTQKAVQGMAATRAKEETGTPAESVEYRNGDVDLDELAPSTLRWIQALASILNSETISEALQKYTLSKQTLETDTETVYADILNKRNEHLLGEMRKMLNSHRVVIIPWGAKHMPAIQKEIEAWGFAETGRARRQALRFQNKALITFISLMDRLPAAGE